MRLSNLAVGTSINDQFELSDREQVNWLVLESYTGLNCNLEKANLIKSNIVFDFPAMKWINSTSNFHVAQL